MASKHSKKTAGQKKKEYSDSHVWIHLFAGFAAFLCLLCLLGIAAIGVCCFIAPDLSEFDPDPEDFYAVILDESGEELDTVDLFSSARKAVSIDEISEEAKSAFLEKLAPDFYEEDGGKAENVIAQGLLENTVFYNWENISTEPGKIIHSIQEKYLIMSMEHSHTKDWILEKYLNTLDFGEGTRGIREASVHYFQILPEKLTGEQANMLMEYAANAGGSKCSVPDVSDWFQQTLLEEVAEDLMENEDYTESEAWNAIFNGGLTIYSTENQNLQNLCSSSAGKSLYIRNQEQVSIVITDNETGAVAAIIGGRKTKNYQTGSDSANDLQDNGFGEHGEELDADIISGGAAARSSEQEGEAEEQINRATEFLRKPGELLAVIGQYAAGLDSGDYTLASIIDDAPEKNEEGKTLDSDDREYAGRITMHEAIAGGNRNAAGIFFSEVGETAVKEMLTAFGLGTLSEESVDCLASGETEGGVTNLEITAAYGAIARGGSYIEPYFYTKVTDSEGKVLLQQQEKQTSVIQKTTAELLTIAMDNIFSGTAAYEKVNSAEVAGISYCAEDGSDAWFTGFSPYYTCTVWGGNDDGSVLEDCSYVQQIWREIMDQAHEGIPGGEERELTDTENLVKVQICTKCGNCAISGLCDRSMQGNKTAEEYFARGTSPVKNCNCHVKVSVCTDSNKIATSHCPSGSVITGVYLKEATQGTDDTEYCVDQLSTEECDIHMGLFEKKD